VGRLSGITYDANAGLYYVLSDDRGQVDDARFYSVAIDDADGVLSDGEIKFTRVTTLLNSESMAFPPGSTDPEGIALTNRPRDSASPRRAQPRLVWSPSSINSR
jgi:hypothetical protein